MTASLLTKKNPIFRPLRYLKNLYEIGYVTNYNNLKIYPEHFRDNLSLRESTRLFKRSVTTIYIEPFSYCNRTCSFCANSTVDRRSRNILMDPKLFQYIVRSLKTINYSEKIHLYRYNEPLSNDKIFDSIAYIRRELPNSKMFIASNGDFLQKGTLEKLRDSGLNRIYITPYLNDYSVDNVLEKGEELCERLMKRLNIKATKNKGTSELKAIRYDLSMDQLQISIFAKNLQHALDRGQSVSIGDQPFLRESPCFEPFRKFDIDYKGQVMACCNIHSDVSSHQSLISAPISIEKGNFFTSYTSPTVVEWRRKLVAPKISIEACRSCEMNADHIGNVINSSGLEEYTKNIQKLMSL